MQLFFSGGGKMNMELELELPPSVNHCYANIKIKGHRSRVLTREASDWKYAAALVAKVAVRNQGWTMLVADCKVVLELVAYWPDRRRRDMNNLHKLLCDALEGVVYLDDKMVLARDMDFFYDKRSPRVRVKIYPKEE